jgi:LytS/YehU family sensor histidine kinase
VFRNRRQLKKQKQELELATRIAELELKVIKSQMNPHFISNSLAAIQDLNYNLETEKAGLYIAKFSYFLRQILNYSDEDYISISEEIVMIRLFVELEQLRFKNGFAFDLIVDDIFSKDEVLIPSLITQPFIENAIWHGLLPLKNARDPKLTIKIISENGLPVIEIEDNGIGRNADRKEKQKGKGTQLVIDKIDTLNRPSRTSNYKIQIIDLIGKDETKMGTKIIIYLDAVKE